MDEISLFPEFFWDNKEGFNETILMRALTPVSLDGKGLLY